VRSFFRQVGFRHGIDTSPYVLLSDKHVL
jgi:hypothetical protein